MTRAASAYTAESTTRSIGRGFAAFCECGGSDRVLLVDEEEQGAHGGALEPSG